MSTTAVFKHIDRTSQPAHIPRLWTKVDAGGTSYTHRLVTRTVHNLRGKPDSEFNTDVTGFGTFRWPSGSSTDFTDDAAVRGPYYDDVVALLKHNCDALPSNVGTGPGGANNKVKRVVLFDHTIRRRLPGAARAPVQQVHVDQTAAAVVARVRRHLPPGEDAEDLLRRRHQIINVWRPISHPASDHPLAVIDWRSTKPDDFFPIDLLYPKRADSVMDGGDDDDDDRGKERPPPTAGDDKYSTEGYEVRGETMGVHPEEDHRFYYIKDMTPDEVLLLKCYDSWGEGEPAGKKDLAVRTPHTAFEDPETPADAKPRESIEVRALVFYEE